MVSRNEEQSPLRESNLITSIYRDAGPARDPTAEAEAGIDTQRAASPDRDTAARSAK